MRKNISSCKNNMVTPLHCSTESKPQSLNGNFCSLDFFITIPNLKGSFCNSPLIEDTSYITQFLTDYNMQKIHKKNLKTKDSVQ